MFQRIIYLYRSFYLSKRTYWTGGAIAFVFASSFFWQPLIELGKITLLLVCFLLLVDFLLLYGKRKALLGGRSCNPRFSNGDDNNIYIELQNNYRFRIHASIIDELPLQFQIRNFNKNISLPAGLAASIPYSLRPLERGEYHFGDVQVFVQSPFAIIIRRFTFPASATIEVYPSYLQMRKYSLLAIANQLTDSGTKRLRKLGHSTEFEQIKDYVHGDDFRTVNWKASARKGDLMVNTYVDEKSQQVFCLLDKSRNMKMPFEGMSLLDYAVNASLILTNVALQKQDKAGLITFAEKVDTFLPPDRKNRQMENVLDALYNQQTKFLDADFEALYAQVRSKIKQRSLLILFTNFESVYSLERQLPYLRRIAHHHLLMVVLFENTEIKILTQTQATNTEEIYIQTIAEKLAYEKRLLVKELKKYGILTVLTTPQQLTINTVNKYLEVKARQAI